MQRTKHPDGARQRGASAVEYALMVTLIAAMLVGAVTLFGGGVGGLFGESQSSFNGAVNP
ncbi:Flp family type IVb pilin [Nocardioides ginsengisoli]|uniref:Flp family type IVb pilin n=1 Tax=Nocardioides ginsengisoli TaxID=363868 RepID=A0ABW3W1Z8_9ACTN